MRQKLRNKNSRKKQDSESLDSTADASKGNSERDSGSSEREFAFIQKYLAIHERLTVHADKQIDRVWKVYGIYAVIILGIISAACVAVYFVLGNSVKDMKSMYRETLDSYQSRAERNIEAYVDKTLRTENVDKLITKKVVSYINQDAGPLISNVVENEIGLLEERIDESEKYLNDKWTEAGVSFTGLRASSFSADSFYRLTGMANTRTSEYWWVARDVVSALNYTFGNYTPKIDAVFVDNPSTNSSMEMTYRTLMGSGSAVRRVIIDRLGKSANTNTDHIVLGHLLAEPDLSVVAACIHALNARFGRNTGSLDRDWWAKWLERNPDRYLYTLASHQGIDAHRDITAIKGYLDNDDGVMPDAKEWAIQYLNELDSEIETGTVNICHLWGLTGMMARITEASFKFSNEPILRPVMELIDISTNKIPFPYDVYLSLDIPENRYNDKTDSK